MKDANSQSSVYRVAADVCFTTDNDGTIILDVQGGKFHSLIQSGSKVWSALAAHPDGITATGLVNRLMDHEEDFAQEPRDKVESAVQKILRRLTRDGLIETNSIAGYGEGGFRALDNLDAYFAGRAPHDRVA